MIYFFLIQDSGPQIVNAMQFEIIGWTNAIIQYVNEFMHEIMPLFIYIAVFQIILKKS